MDRPLMSYLLVEYEVIGLGNLLQKRAEKRQIHRKRFKTVKRKKGENMISLFSTGIFLMSSAAWSTGMATKVSVFTFPKFPSANRNVMAVSLFGNSARAL